MRVKISTKPNKTTPKSVKKQQKSLPGSPEMMQQAGARESATLFCRFANFCDFSLFLSLRRFYGEL